MSCPKEILSVVILQVLFDPTPMSLSTFLLNKNLHKATPNDGGIDVDLDALFHSTVAVSKFRKPSLALTGVSTVLRLRLPQLLLRILTALHALKSASSMRRKGVQIVS